MPQQGRQGRDDQNERQHLEGKGEQGALVAHRIGLVAAGQIAEHELRPLIGRGADSIDRTGDGRQHIL